MVSSVDLLKQRITFCDSLPFGQKDFFSSSGCKQVDAWMERAQCLSKALLFVSYDFLLFPPPPNKKIIWEVPSADQLFKSRIFFFFPELWPGSLLELPWLETC